MNPPKFTRDVSANGTEEIIFPSSLITSQTIKLPKELFKPIAPDVKRASNSQQTQRHKAALLHTQAVSILGVEAGVIDQVDTTANDIARGKRWAVRLSRSRGTE